jgi:hypothetical protein
MAERRYQLHSKILALLNNHCYVIGGAHSWEKIFIGQTECWTNTIWIYNDGVTNTVREGDVTYVLSKKRFPKQPPLEYWIVDMFDWHAYIAKVNREIMLLYVQDHLRSGLISKDVLWNMFRLYGTPETVAYFESHLPCHDFKKQFILQDSAVKTLVLTAIVIFLVGLSKLR